MSVIGEQIKKYRGIRGMTLKGEKPSVYIYYFEK